MNAIASTNRMSGANRNNTSYSEIDPDSRWLPDLFAQSDLTAPEDNSTDNQRIVAAAVAILAQGEDLVCALSVENYTRRVPLAFNGSIGGHYRHCLDHFTSLLGGLGSDEVDYDHRERDARMESQPDFALCLTQQIRLRLQGVPVSALDSPVRARCEVS